MLNKDEGTRAVKLARKSLTLFVNKRERARPEDLPSVFNEKRGVFVTLNKDDNLRGCIGYPQPIMELGKAIVDSAINAGTTDPRFPPVTPEELGDIVIEVTVLTEPRPYNVKKHQLPDAVEIGRHGLIISRGMFSGLLLPQVATEWNFDAIDFLSQTCLKAGLPADAWIDPETEVMYFEGQIFAEVQPMGEVVEKDIQMCK
jgi:uncharacterized protein (TIGR00296 family)